MSTEIIKYITESGAVYFQTLTYENDKLVSESWKREAKRPWNVKIDMAAYVSPKMKKDLEIEYGLVEEDEDEKNKREDLEDMIVRGKAKGYKELGGSITSLTSNSKLAFSKTVISREKVK